MTQNNSEYDLEKEEYYILDENSDKDKGYSSTEHEDNEEHEEENNDNDDDEERTTADHEDDSTPKETKKNPISLLLAMMINPVEGWKNIRRAHLSPEDVAARCFYPLTACAAISEFMTYVYTVPSSLSEVLIQALSVFIAFFFGYFLVLILDKIFLPASCREGAVSTYGKLYTLYLLSTLALFYILANIVPMLEAVWVFLPLWTIYLGSKGIRFFRFPDKRTTLITVLLCAFIILSPLTIYTIFSELLNV